MTDYTHRTAKITAWFLFIMGFIISLMIWIVEVILKYHEWLLSYNDGLFYLSFVILFGCAVGIVFIGAMLDKAYKIVSAIVGMIGFTVFVMLYLIERGLM